MKLFVVSVLAAAFGLGVAQAQVVERNLPPEPPSRGPAPRLNPDLLRSDDTTPLGANLRAIVLIGAKDKVSRRKANGIALRAPLLNPDAIRSRLTAFLGQPVSRKLITDIQAAIAGVYRDANRPFVSVTVPPQEITGGVLQVRVVEARLGGVNVHGANAGADRYILDRVHVVRGQPIDARLLDTDLDWLNRNPFRRVEAVFGPGKELAETELVLQTTESKPWQVFTGYANSGTRLTGRDRYFAGGTAAFPGDIVTSLQLTGSRDFWVNNGRAFEDVSRSGYYSPAGRVTIPLWLRSSLEIVGDYVQTNERPSDPFRIRTATSEVSATYRSALANLAPAALGDALAGIELKRQDRRTFFAETQAVEGRADVGQWFLGWNGRWSDAFGVNSFDGRAKTNSGGMLPANTNADWNVFTNGRVTNIHTTFAMLQYGRRTPLILGTYLLTEATALLSNKALPDTERLGLGGAQTVRGYVTEDGVVDKAIIVRNSLYIPSIDLGSAFGQSRTKASLAPFVFTDYGSGRDIFLARSTSLLSTGVGFDFQIAPYLTTNFLVARAMRAGDFTDTGTWRIQARATASY